MFDISKLSADTSDKGSVMEVIDPTTGRPAKGENGSSVTITLRSNDSPVVRDVRRDIVEKASRQQNRRMTTEEIDAEFVEILAAATVDWSFTKIDGNDFPCTRDNARKFWADPRFAHIRRQADQFISNVANFMKG